MDKLDFISPGWWRRCSLLVIVLFLAGCNGQARLAVSPTDTLPIATAQPATGQPSAQAVTTPSPSPASPTPTPLASPTPSPQPASPTPVLPTVSSQTATVELTETPTTPPATTASCESTRPDALGPFYVSDAPQRAQVGQGHVLSGVVRSSADCTAIAGAQLEFWLAGPNGQYDDEHRATLFADDSGSYQFESNFPPPYSGRPPHLHLRVTAGGYQPLVTQYYPVEGQTEGIFDLVLMPDPEAQNPLTVTSSAPETDSEQPEALTLSGARLPAPTLFDVTWVDRSAFRPGLIETEQAVLAQLPGASVYHLDLEISDELVHLQGREEVFYTNREDESLSELYFRLFPNLTGGSTTIQTVTVNDRVVEPIYELQDSAMRLPLSPVLPPGEAVVVQMEFSVVVPEAEGGNYGTFAFAGDVLALAHFYPMLAVYDDEGWNVEIAPQIGDVVYADASFYRVRVTAPVTPTLVASGIEFSREYKDNQQVVTYVAGPGRDFYLAASDRYTVTSRTLGQTTINSYVPAELADGAELALDQTEKALQSFNERFGPYPYTEFDLVSTTTFALGVEYPGLVAILVDLYDQTKTVRSTSASVLLEGVVAHEVAHQWFYNVVGNDQVDEPWLDEALAQYATLLYYADVYGSPGVAGFRRSVEGRWDRVDRADIPIGMPVRAYTPEEYSAIVYGRGPLFVETLAETMGQDVFEAFLRDYYQTYQWDIATGDEFEALAEEHCDCDLTPLFEEWVYEQATADP